MSWVRFGSPTSFFTASAATDLWTAPTTHGLIAGTPIYFYDVNGGGVNIPSPLFNATTYYVASAGLTTTQFKTAYTVGGLPVDLFTDSGGSGVWLFIDTTPVGGSGFVPNFLAVPSQTGTGVDVDKINATIRGRKYIPQPFLSLLNVINVDEVFLPDGFVGNVYSVTEHFSDYAVVTLLSGSLPPGLAISQPAPPPVSFTIDGTPTTVGTYVFTLKLVRGTSVSNVSYHLTVNTTTTIDAVAGGMLGG